MACSSAASAGHNAPRIHIIRYTGHNSTPVAIQKRFSSHPGNVHTTVISAMKRKNMKIYILIKRFLFYHKIIYLSS